MSQSPDLLALRNLGWQHWDPIGLVADRKHCDDEYDSYMKYAYAMCLEGASLEKITEYLEHIETDYIGLQVQEDTKKRAFGTASALKNYASSVQNKPLIG
jgi:hypothetical protein